MKNIGTVRLALIYAGCFLGAGYVSGQELWQFLGSFGTKGYLGLCFAMLLLFFFGVLMLRLAQDTGESDVDRVVIPWKAPWLHALLGILVCVFFFGVVAIMNAGVGAMLQQMFSVPHIIGSAVFSLLILLLALFGLQGLASAFSVSVPLLVICTVIFGIITVRENGFTLAAASVENKNMLLGHWGISALNYASYNIFAALGIMIPFGAYIGKKRTVYGGVGLATVLLSLIAMSVLLSLHAYPEAAEAELPMLSYAQHLGGGFACIYALLLFLAMFGTALSSLVAMVEYLELKRPQLKQRHKAFVSALVLLGFAAGLFGFGDLIGFIYPIFGYAGMVFLVCMPVQKMKQKHKAS